MAGIVLCCASQGFCSIIDTHFITLFCGGVCVCALAAEPSGLNLCIVLGFVFCVLKYHLCCLRWILHASTSKNAPVCFREISLSATGHVCVSSFIPLLSSSNTSAVKMLLQLSCCIRHRCCYDPSGQNRFSRNYLNNIWAQGREKAEEGFRPRGRSAVIEP